MERSRLLVLLVALTVALSTPAVTAQDESIRWVINYHRASIPGNAAATIKAAGGRLVRTLPQVGIAIAVSSDPIFASRMMRVGGVHSIGEVAVMSLPQVTVVPADIAPAMVPDPPAAFWDLLWGIARVNAHAAWDAGITGSHDTVVAVIDTGIAGKRVLNYVVQQGTYVVASAGNSNLNLNGPWLNVPGGVPGITAVGATGIRPDAVFPQPGAFDVRAFYSNYGAAVEVVAPGGDCGLPDSCDPATRPANWFEFLVLSAFVAPNPACAATQSCPVGWAFAGGTSQAAPHVWGVAGLVRDQNPTLSPNQVKAILMQTAERLGDRQQFGHGMVDAFAAATRR